MQVEYNDGGRQAAGFKGSTGDCVCRSICIVTGLPYDQVYSRLSEGNALQRRSKYDKKSMAGKKTASRGIFVKRKWFRDYMVELGFEWVPCMAIGKGCTVHLTDGELPMGKLIVSLSKHFTAVIDGVIHDTYNPQRNTIVVSADGSTKSMKRCVYGYYILNNK